MALLHCTGPLSCSAEMSNINSTSTSTEGNWAANLQWQSWEAELTNSIVCASWPSSCTGQRKSDEGGNWKGNCPVVSIPHLLIHLDRGPCCKTTNDLYMQQWHGDHYITTSQIIVAITTGGSESATAASWMWQNHLQWMKPLHQRTSLWSESFHFHFWPL